MTDRTRTTDGLSPEAQEYWRELSKLPPAQALTRTQAADPAPPLTEADPLSEWIARIVFAFPSGDSRRDDIRVLAARALTLESELAQLRAFIGHVADGGSIVSTAAMTPTQIAVARAAERMFVTQDGLGFVYVPGPLTASEQDELAQLRREKAERERELDALSEGLMLLKAIDEARK